MAIGNSTQYNRDVFDDILSPPPASDANNAILAGLNEAQRQAVESTEGPLLILAGAGTGKTRVLTTRFAWIVEQNKAAPWQILSVTFTNKAAREMRERISRILDRPVEGLWLGTFHALCVRMLRRHAALMGLEGNFTVLDTDDQLRLLKQIIADSPTDIKIDTKRTPPAQLLNIFQTWKDRAVLPENVSSTLENDAIKDMKHGVLRQIYTRYQDRLRALNASDFGDLMLHMVTIFRTHPEVLAEYQKRFRYIMVDEYQDTNTIQYLWLRLLSGRSDGSPANLACVGDDDQSIYSWRGADVRNILQFGQDFPGARIIRLEKNYRSTPHILGAASGLIAHNEGRLGKTLQTGHELAEPGAPVLVVHTPDSDEEARIVGQMIENIRKDGKTYGEMAVLMRAGFQSRPFEDVFMRMAIPYQVIGGLRFYERAEVRDGTAYMRILVQPSDDLAFERIINMPKRGFGDAALARLRDYARNHGLSLLNALEKQYREGTLKGRNIEQLTGFIEALDEARAILPAQGHVVAVETLLEKSGYLQMWKDSKAPEAAGRLDNIHELLRAIGSFPGLPEFLEHIALVMDADSVQDESGKVSIMTLHASKGLEFDIVFLPGWEEDLFPSMRSLEEKGNQALEEERRLAYVGLTRARKQAIILHASRRRRYTEWLDSLPSRFIEELPENHIVHKESKNPRQSSFGGASFGHPSFGWTSYFGRGTLLRHSGSGGMGGISPGSTVRHKRHGTGIVTARDGDRLTINFEESGEKQIMADYVEVIS